VCSRQLTPATRVLMFWQRFRICSSISTSPVGSVISSRVPTGTFGRSKTASTSWDRAPADRNTRSGPRLSEHVAAVGGYSVCVVVGGHPVEGLPRLRVRRHNSTQHDPSARRTVRCRIAAEDDLGVRRVIRQLWIAIEPACRRLLLHPLKTPLPLGGPWDRDPAPLSALCA
jgi:hypothetical protein